MPFADRLLRGGGDFAKRLKFTLAGALAMALFFSLIATLQLVFGGTAAFARVGASYPAVVVGYLIAAVIAGLILALLWPLGRWWAGALLLGYVTAVPVFLIMAAIIRERVQEAFSAALVLSLAFGPPLGFYGWYMSRHYKPPLG